MSSLKNDQTFNHTVMVLNGYTEFQKHCEDEFKINHSFNSDIHLKNNKNFIPKEQLMTKKTEPILFHRS
jgi:hypothetical protein